MKQIQISYVYKYKILKNMKQQQSNIYTHTHTQCIPTVGDVEVLKVEVLNGRFQRL